MKLMIVDDSLTFKIMVKEMLSQQFYLFKECNNGLEAVNSYETFSPDFVLMDIKMPIMNGLDALNKIKTLHPDAKIIMITQYKDKELESTALNYGAYAFLLKENLVDLEKILTIKLKGG
jgi:CheY-like chemotaxis protein